MTYFHLMRDAQLSFRGSNFIFTCPSCNASYPNPEPPSAVRTRFPCDRCGITFTVFVDIPPVEPSQIVVTDTDRAVAGEAVALGIAAVAGGMVVCGVIISAMLHSFTWLVVLALAAVPACIVFWKFRYSKRLHTIALSRTTREHIKAWKEAQDAAQKRALAEAERLRRLEREESEYRHWLSQQRAALTNSFRTLTQRRSQIDKLLLTARDEYDASAFSPFWDAIEASAKHLAATQRQLLDTSEVMAAYCARARATDMDLVAQSNLPSFEDTSGTLMQLLRLGQSNFQFAVIWEHRKTRAAVIEGFGTLGDAISALEGAVTTSMAAVRKTVAYAHDESMSARAAAEHHIIDIKANTADIATASKQILSRMKPH